MCTRSTAALKQLRTLQAGEGSEASKTGPLKKSVGDCCICTLLSQIRMIQQANVHPGDRSLRCQRVPVPFHCAMLTRIPLQMHTTDAGTSSPWLLLPPVSHVRGLGS